MKKKRCTHVVDFGRISFLFPPYRAHEDQETKDRQAPPGSTKHPRLHHTSFYM